ncbi:hypothetical protein [uncultured Stenotrophomonas sp.]|uniref:hypothetical protein n=1 Tax=uncultured Stenotrophomonas sp. TaxID=165438 RepID=UPI0025E87C97|nr:hypothetical protein [uncultured Stenotrophomonas sp.]
MTTRKNSPLHSVSAINDDEDPASDLSTFQGCLTRIRDGEGSDGMLWPEEKLSDGRRQSLARIDRAATGILTAVEMLHAANRCKTMATPRRHLDEGVVEGLFFACRELAELVCREVRPTDLTAHPPHGSGGPCPAEHQSHRTPDLR